MKMKERFHAVCRFLNMISQGNHRVLFWLFGSAFTAAALPDYSQCLARFHPIGYPIDCLYDAPLCSKIRVQIH